MDWLNNAKLIEKEMSKRNPVIASAIIGAVAVIGAAAIGALLQPSWWRSGPHEKIDLVIAGTVVDQATNQAVAQANISLAGRTETYVTEDNGNFRIKLQELPENGRARLHVIKDGYRPYDAVVSSPTEALIIPLRRM